MAKMNFGGVKEDVVTRKEFTLKNAKSALKKHTIAVIGYGVQGPAQALNLRDNGFNVIVGQRKDSKSWKKALADGWKPGKTLFEIEEAAEKGTIISYLLSDAAQIAVWPTVKKHLTKGKTLYFSHGFAVTFFKQSGIVPPKDVDVILVAPKGSGTTVRKIFLEGRGINSSYAVYQNATGKAEETVKAMGIGIGSGFLFKTTFEKEVYSDLTGERGVLIGAIAGVMEAQYNLLRKMGHSPSEAFNETVEEATQSLIPLVGEKGMDWMLANVSTTAQRGALDWKDKFRDATAPVFKELYESVKTGKEAARTIKKNSEPDYRAKLEKELDEINKSEMWQAGKKVRELRPENQK
jgi:ketol-acid reductoisomerase